MNGRVYDYNVGRFLSVDPFVHGGSQGINPYSYIMNNPLAGTDPTGYTPEEEVDLEEMDATEVESITASEDGSVVHINKTDGSTIKANGSYVSNKPNASISMSGKANLDQSQIGALAEPASKTNDTTSDASISSQKKGPITSKQAAELSNNGEESVSLLDLLGGDEELAAVVREGIRQASSLLSTKPDESMMGMTISKTEDGYVLGDPNTTVGRGLDQILVGGESSRVIKVNSDEHVLAINVNRFSTKNNIRYGPKMYNHISNKTGVPYIQVSKRFGNFHFYSPSQSDVTIPLTEIDMKRN